MKEVVSVLFFIAGIVGAIYFGGWLLFVKPIWACCLAFDAGTLKATMVGLAIFKCCMASFVAVICVSVGTLLANVINN